MPLRRLPALLLSTLACACAHAAPRPLSDTEMSAVRGADGSILAGLQGGPAPALNPFAAGLAAAFGSSTGATTLTPAQFAAALENAGLPATIFADYAGQPVAQTVVDARPLTFTFSLSDVLQATTGVAYSSGTGASMGLLTLRDFDARGTTMWVWHH